MMHKKQELARVWKQTLGHYILIAAIEMAQDEWTAFMDTRTMKFPEQEGKGSSFDVIQLVRYGAILTETEARGFFRFTLIKYYKNNS